MNKNSITKLIKNIEKRAKGPEQGSDAWLALRVPNKDRKRGRIGGSDMATLLNLNPYGSRKELMLCKQGKKKVKIDNVFVHLGSLLEEITVIYFEKIFNTTVYCKNISLVDPTGIQSVIFSPDGLCCMPLKNNKIQLEPMTDDTKCCPVLIEIKNPWSRKLTRNGDVPAQYKPQVQAGLMSIPDTHCGIFIDSQTKLCEYRQLFTDGYNSELHRGNSRIDNEDQKPLSMGIVLCYGELPKEFNKRYCKKVKFDKKSVYDFGSVTQQNNCSNLLKSIKYNQLKVEYHPLYNNAEEAENDSEIDNIIKDKNAIGIICYKIYDITYTVCYRDIEMIKEIKSELKKYGEGDYDIDGDYVMRKRKRSASKQRTGLPNLQFDFDSDDGEEGDKKFTFSDSDDD
uniref:YqaJ viral recombinase domain-containing protein n=1 Tax=viral metagenome TaxID=1070528 RepID=A0A6C0LJ23_9ZZZZ